MASSMSADSELDRAMQKLDQEVREGIKYGFFKLTITCEMISGHKRRLTLTSGKSYQFTIPEEELLGKTLE
jgi:hypothetical protein